MKQERRSWSAEEKTRVLRRHLIEKIPISKVCDEEKVSPSMYHRWQEQLFQNAALALEGKRTEQPPGTAEYRETGTEDSSKRRSLGRTDGGAQGPKKSLGPLNGCWVELPMPATFSRVLQVDHKRSTIIFRPAPRRTTCAKSASYRPTAAPAPSPKTQNPTNLAVRPS